MVERELAEPGPQSDRLAAFLVTGTGAVAVEYAVLGAAVAVIAIGLAALGGTLSGSMFDTFAGYFK